MTLLDLANFICGKVNQSEAEDVLACKGFLQRRFDVIWADQLWKDSLFEYTQALSATGYDVDHTWLPTKQVLLLPTQFSNVVAVRTGSNKLNVISSDLLYRMDFDTFNNSGLPMQFRLLPQCVWELEAAALVAVFANSEPGSIITIKYLSSDGVTLAKLLGDLGGDNFFTGGRIDSVSKKTTSGPVTLSQAGGANTVFLTLAAADLAAPKRCRIQIFGSMPDPSTIRVLGKTKTPAFTDDGDEPALTGVDNCLLAFAQGDMLQRERQYGKAQALYQEAALLLDQLKRVETVQEAHNQRMIPENGYGDDDFRVLGGLSF